MYGTISRQRVKPGMLDALRAWNEANRPEDTGPGVMLVYQMDRDPNEIFVVIAAESREAYRAASENPKMHERYLKMLEYLDGEPEWNDGTVIASEINL
jgi:hypothetical protein